MNTLIREDKVGGIISQPQAVGKDWEIVIIESGLSDNGYFYSENTLREAAHLFEGHRVCLYQFGDLASHLPLQVVENQHPDFAANVVGWIHGVGYGKFTRPDGSSGNGILGKFHIMEGFESLRKNMKDAWTHGKWDFLGFSIDAGGMTERISMNGQMVNNVIKIQEVSSTDLVSRPAAGGNLLRLAASKGANGMKRILETIQKHRSSWFNGFAMIEDGGNEQDYLLRILESNLVKAQESQDTIHSDEVQKLAEVARGVKALTSVIDMIRSSKVDEAVKTLTGWIGTHSEAKDNAYTFPYKAPTALVEEDGGGEPEKETETEKETQKETEKEKEKETEGGTEHKEKEESENTETETKQESEKRMDLEKREGELIVKEKLIESGLSQPARNRIQQLFEGKTGIIGEEVEKAIKSEKEYIDSLKEATGNIEGLGNAHGSNETLAVGKDQKEKLEKAFDGLFAGHDIDNVPMFSTLSEAWGHSTGGKWGSREQTADWIYESIALSLPQSFRQDREKHKRMIESNWKDMASMNLREAVATTDFPVAFGDALFRRLQKEFTDDPLNDWRKIVSSIENLSDATNDFNVIRLGATSTLPTVAQNAPYQELTPATPNEEVEKITPVKKGGLFKLTWEDVLADRVGVVRRIPRMLARSTNRTIHEAVWDEIETNPALVTGFDLISTDNSNLVSGSPVLSFAGVASAILLLRDQTELDSGKRLGLTPKFLLVGTKLERLAFEIASPVKVTGAEDSTLPSFVNHLGIESFPTLGLGRTASTDDRWYVAASPRDAETIAIGFLGGRQTPEIFVQGRETPTAGAFFDADAITFKVRLVFGVQVIDHRWIAGSLK